MKTQVSFDYDQLIKCGRGELFGPGNAQLPLPPMLMFDRITKIDRNSGDYRRGEMISELDVTKDHWFFKCHFDGDPVMPGCLGLDALWQMVGFYLAWLGHPGQGRALGCGEVKFSGQVTPDVRKLTYSINIKRLVTRKLIMGIADGRVTADNKTIYAGKDLRVGLFNIPTSS